MFLAKKFLKKNKKFFKKRIDKIYCIGYSIIEITKNVTNVAIGGGGMQKKRKPFVKVKARLVEKGLRQADLAKRMGISPQSLNHKLNGFSDFWLSELEQIAEILDIKDDQYKEYFFS